ncbi:DUF899 family protein [Catenulispora sp. MAP5-51]|uniref:DUF899 family protein n=1 Tax=Catenulispora sp. MAP5-51 TaxID=3156298 RepID=UPI0035190DFB
MAQAKRFPGESTEYRTARDALLQEEVELRRQVERVAEQRRALPVGGAVDDYVFHGVDGEVRLADLFAPGQQTLILYNFMYGPEMDAACPMCTSFLDGLNGNAGHITQQVGLAVVAKSPLPRILEYAEGRGWDGLTMVSSADNMFNRDYHGEDEHGDQESIIHVFAKDVDGEVRHRYSSELIFVPGDPGQDTRHIDAGWPLWNILDLTPTGRGSAWYPRREY